MPSNLQHYHNPTQRFFGPGCFGEIGRIVRTLNIKSVLVVMGERSFSSSLHFQKLQHALAACRIIYSSPIPANPTQRLIQNEMNRRKGGSVDLVLAIGGGSVLDVGKLLTVIPVCKTTRLTAYLNSPPVIAKTPPPLIAVPTTAGTGSEVTPYASFETSDKKKVSVEHAALYPTFALIDPMLSITLSPYTTAVTGLDALSQAIESFWSIRATVFSRVHSLHAVELILRHFEAAYRQPSKIKARAGMALAACEAGLAIAQTKTTAVHSVSYPLTTHFGIAHGHACALTLPSFVRFNAPCLKKDGSPLLKLFRVTSCDGMAKKIESLMDRLNIERSLTRLGLGKNDVALVLREGFRPNRIRNNPRSVATQDLRKILDAIR